MNHAKEILRLCALALLVLGAADRVLAQDEQQPQHPSPQPSDSEPKPAARSTPLPAIEDQSDYNPNQGNQMQPDDTPLTGMLSPTLGTLQVTHSYWAAGLQYAASVQANGYGNSGWFAYNYVAGNLSLLQAWSHAQFAVNYSGGAYFETNASNGSYQGVSLSQNFDYNRWKIQIQDSFSYTPQSGFGFGGGTNLGTPGVGGSIGPTLPGVNNGSLANQSVYGGLGPQYFNVGILQASYSISRRSSITVSGAYGLLHFIDPGYIDSNSLYAGLGYSYKLSPKDSIGVVYQFGNYQFPGDPQAYANHIASLAYGRKVTGRLALSLYGGPQYTSFRIPVGTTSDKLGGYASASLSYALERGMLSVSYLHGLTGGGGLLTGSISDQVYFSADRRLTRVWDGHVNFGYSHNATVVSSSTTGNSNYSSWFVGGGVSRPFGRYVTFGAAYTASISTFNLSGCPGTTCGPSSDSLYQTITASFQWHTRPFILP